MTGRPSKLTKETHNKIVQDILLGATYEHAANCIGITYDTLNNWRKRGEQEENRRKSETVIDNKKTRKEQPFFDFHTAIEQAIKNKTFETADLDPDNWRNVAPKGKLDKKQRYLYIVRETWQGMCKIGVASDIYARMSSLQTGCPQELEVVGFVALKNAKSMELFIHNRYKEFHHRGEWFNISNEQVQTILDFVNAETLIEESSHAVVGHNYSFSFGKKD